MSDAPLTQSVKKYDQLALDGMSVYKLIIPFPLGDSGLLPKGLPIGLPPQWKARDRVLRAATRYEGMWHAAVGIKIDKTVALGYQINPESGSTPPLRVRQAYSVFKRQPFIPILKKLLRDYWTTNNGAVMEVIHATSARGSRVVAIDHLDSNWCQRTGDPERPIIYTDRSGRQHVMKAHQVICFSHMERSDREANGMGECAAEGTYEFILELASINRFLLEKVVGRRPLAIYLVGGAGGTNIESGVKAAQATEDETGQAYHYMGAAIVSIPQAENLKSIEIPLSSLPNGFDETSRWDKCLLAYAKNLELDPQDMQPIRAGIGTATQSTLLHSKANQTDSFIRALCTSVAEQGVIPPGTTYTMPTTDLGEQQARAELSKTHTEDYAQQIDKGIIDADQARQLKVDNNELPAAFLTAPDQTPAQVLADTDNPSSTEESQSE